MMESASTRNEDLRKRKTKEMTTQEGKCDGASQHKKGRLRKEKNKGNEDLERKP